MTQLSKTPGKSFGSDNHAGAHPAVLRAMMDANSGDAVAYGADDWTAQVTARLRETFRADDAFLVLNGSGANVLGLSMLLRRHEAVICAESAHINTDECGSSERLLGTKLLTIPAADGKLTPDLIAERLSGRGDDHRAQPGVVAITQSTELGTCYTLAELRKVADFCRASDLRLYLDGARLANSAAFLDCSLAELAEHADVLSFGGTKNGAVGAESLDRDAPRPSRRRAVPAQAADPAHLEDAFRRGPVRRPPIRRPLALQRGPRQRHGPPPSCGSGRRGGVEVVYPVQANAVFARLHPRHIAALQQRWTFHVWDERESVVRWMAAFDTTEARRGCLPRQHSRDSYRVVMALAS